MFCREKLQQFLWKLKQPDGSFEMHEGGEIDMRGIYCAVSIAKLTNIYTDELFKNSAEWIASCQTYEGGFSGCPDMEAHGGYAFCGLAALVLLNKEYLLNIHKFLVCKEFIEKQKITKLLVYSKLQISKQNIKKKNDISNIMPCFPHLLN